MINHTKLLVFFSLLIIIGGSIILWFGLQQPVSQTIPAVPNPVEESIPEGKPVVSGVEGQLVLIIRVIDGDTIELEDGSKVRLLGIDTPETKDTRKAVECFGKQAASETKRLLEGKMALLEKDVSEKDKYQRLLRYIYLPLENGQTLFVNDYLIREGFAKALNYPPDVKYNELLREAESQAKRDRRGLWGIC